MATTLKHIDPTQVFKLAQIGCTTEEIASVVKCCAKTLERRFAEDMKRGRNELRVSLRAMQLKEAKKGNTALLIFLGKQFLGQSNEPQIVGGTMIAVPDMITMVARMDASIPLRPEKPLNGNGNGKANGNGNGNGNGKGV